MSHQGQDGWYPECKICEAGNLGSKVVCKDCYKEIQAHYKTRRLTQDEIEEAILRKCREVEINSTKWVRKQFAIAIFKAQEEKLNK